MHFRHIGLPHARQVSIAGSDLCFAQTWTAGSALALSTASDGAAATAAGSLAWDFDILKPDCGAGGGGGGGGLAAMGGCATAGIESLAGGAVGAADDCCRMISLASAVASASHPGQLMGIGIRWFTGSTSNSKRVPQLHWTLTFMVRASG